MRRSSLKPKFRSCSVVFAASTRPRPLCSTPLLEQQQGQKRAFHQFTRLQYVHASIRRQLATSEIELVETLVHC